jgi:PAP2 superfamily
LSVDSNSSVFPGTGDLPLSTRGPGIAALVSHEAVIKWLLLALVGSVDGIWMMAAGFHFGPGYLPALAWVFLLIMISLFYYYTGRDNRIMNFAHFGAQYVSLLIVLMPLSYLAVSTNAPLSDREFDAIDRALGFNWISWTEWIIAHPILRRVLSMAYDSLPFQALFCYIYNVHKRTNWRNNEIWWITGISAVVTIAVSALLPGTNPYVYYGLLGPDHFLHMQHFLGLRDGTMHVIGLTDAQGLIQLPSFHTVLAIMLTYNLRHNRLFFSAALILNITLILSCPSEGSHYFIDLPAGAAVAVATIWAVRRLQRRLIGIPSRVTWGQRSQA